jgi:hypothetical protein
MADINESPEQTRIQHLEMIAESMGERAYEQMCSANTLGEIARQLPTLLADVEMEWLGYVAAIYPDVCAGWEDSLTTHRLIGSGVRGLTLVAVAKSWAPGGPAIQFLPKAQAEGVIERIADKATRELAYDHLFEHDPAKETVFILQVMAFNPEDPNRGNLASPSAEVSAIGAFRLKLPTLSE